MNVLKELFDTKKKNLETILQVKNLKIYEQIEYSIFQYESYYYFSSKIKEILMIGSDDILNDINNIEKKMKEIIKTKINKYNTNLKLINLVKNICIVNFDKK